MSSKLPFDVVKDLSGVGVIATSPMVLIVSPQTPFTSVADLISYAKANPGKLSYSHRAWARRSIWAAELFKAMTGTDIVHIPYKGGAPAVAAVASNKVPLLSPPSIRRCRSSKAIASRPSRPARGSHFRS